MTDKTQNKCGFAEQLAAYIYEEIASDEKKVFEAHLAKCEACTDELAGLGLARSAVNEWYMEEFAPLATPVIKLPAVEKETITVPANAGWLDSLKRLFTTPPAWATAGGAFAVLFLMLGLFYWSSIVPSGNDIAGINKIVVAPTSLPSTDNTENKSGTPETGKNGGDNVTNQGPLTGDKNNQKAVEPMTISAPAGSTSKQSDHNVKKGSKQIAPKQNPKAPMNKRKSSPSLLDSNTDEEETLRLSDLLEDITVSDLR